MNATNLPQDPILVRLLAASQRSADPPPMIHDVTGLTKSYPHLLGDILATRRRLLQCLPDPLVDGPRQLLDQDSSPYIFLLCQSGYEYLVGFFAIRALGGAVVPLAQGILPAEAVYLVRQTRASCVLFGKGCDDKAGVISTAILEAAAAAGKDDRDATLAAFASCAVSTDAEPLDAAAVAIDPAQSLSPRGPGLVLLTSGTSGPPKMAVLPRQTFVVDEPMAPPGGAGFNSRPGQWIGAVDAMMEPILNGQSLHCIGQRAGVSELVDAMVAHYITHALFSPLVLGRMRDHILQSSSSADGAITDDVRTKYGGIFRGMNSIRCGGATISPAVRAFWTDLTGLPLNNFYASTESGIRATNCLDGEDGCIGLPVKEVELKLSDEPVGEIRLKCNTMFTHYIGDEKATRAAFDEDGFLKTGDVGRFHNGQFYILGRQNLDIIRLNHLSFAASDVERALLALPGIREACVVGVSVRARAQMCGAVIRADTGCDTSLASIRAGLRGTTDGLPVYMLPVFLRVLADDEALPLTTISGKMAKGLVRANFFTGGNAAAELDSPADVPEGVQVWHALPSSDEMGAFKGDAAVKAWDWGGMQSV